jgi:hypothetical protein
MRQRVQDIVRVGDALFASARRSCRCGRREAENFHVMRADFTRAALLLRGVRLLPDDGRPARCHRDLKNAFSSMLRRDQWFHAKTDSELVNEDRDAKIWLDWASQDPCAARCTTAAPASCAPPRKPTATSAPSATR